jgi:hypothetical protein
MKTVSLKAHLDGQKICLDEPFEFPASAQLLVTVLPPKPEVEDEEWYALWKRSLARAYDDDEPDYSAVPKQPASQ